MMPTQACDPGSDELLDMVGKAVNHLAARDSHLLQMAAAERSVTHKLAEYLRFYLDERFNLTLDAVPRIAVDCEYNRSGDEAGTPKKLPLNGDLYVKGEPYYLANPDIIVHHRGDQVANLVVIEVKTFFNKRPAAVLLDKLKLVGYLGHPTYYETGIYLDFCRPDQGKVISEAKLITKNGIMNTAGERMEARDYYWYEGKKLVWGQDGGQLQFTEKSDDLALKLMKGLEEAYGFQPILGTK